MCWPPADTWKELRCRLPEVQLFNNNNEELLERPCVNGPKKRASRVLGPAAIQMTMVCMVFPPLLLEVCVLDSKYFR